MSLNEEFKEFKTPIIDLMKSIYDTANFPACENAKANNIKEAILKPNDNFAKKEFQDLWKKLKIKTVYEVDFNSEELISKSISEIDNKLTIKKVKIMITVGEQKERMTDLELKAKESMIKMKSTVEHADTLLGDIEYDLIGEIAKETRLLRKTVVKILEGLKASTFENFRINPEDFIRQVSLIINEQKASTLINSIKYSKTDNSYEDDIFTIKNFQGTLGKNILEVKNHIYDYLKYDSDVEADFSNDLETGEVLVYAKLPRDFKIPTPVGNYNPDWAIVFDTEKVKYIYFIAETKGSLSSLELGGIENLKVEYAKKHFESLADANIKYDVVKTYQDLLDRVLR